MTHLAQARTLCATSATGYRSGDSVQLGIERKDDGALIGTCTLFHFHATEPPRRDRLRARPSRTGARAYMHEALQRLLPTRSTISASFGSRRTSIPRNVASAAHARLGSASSRRAIMRERWIVGDASPTPPLFGLLRREWHGP